MKFPTVYVSHQLFLHIVLLIILKGTAILLFRLPTCQWNQLSAFNVHRRDHSRAGSRNKRGCLIFLIPWRMRYFMEVYFSGQPKLLPETSKFVFTSEKWCSRVVKSTEWIVCISFLIVPLCSFATLGSCTEPFLPLFPHL